MTQPNDPKKQPQRMPNQPEEREPRENHDRSRPIPEQNEPGLETDENR